MHTPSDSTLQALTSPALTRARATVVSTEATTLGLAASLHIALALASLKRPEIVASFARGGSVLCGALAALGVMWLVLVRYLRLGRSPDPEDPLWRSLPVAIGAGGVLALTEVVIVALSSGDGARAVTALRAALPVPVVGLALSSLRVVAAVEGRSITPVADATLVSSHALLGGLSGCMLVGLLSRTMSAELTYELGIGTTMAALWTLLAAIRVLQGSRRTLLAERAAGRRWPTSERSQRSAVLVLALGVVVPTGVIALALASARLTGVELACVALAVSVHTLRYATVTMRYGPGPSTPLPGLP